MTKIRQLPLLPIVQLCLKNIHTFEFTVKSRQMFRLQFSLSLRLIGSLNNDIFATFIGTEKVQRGASPHASGARLPTAYENRMNEGELSEASQISVSMPSPSFAIC